MVQLVRPHVRYHRSYLDASDEFAETGEHRDGDGMWQEPADDGFPGRNFTRVGLEDPTEFARFVQDRLASADPAAPRKAGWVPCSFYWMDEDGEYVGSLALRHSLDNEFLREEGGHIGYSVRPSARRRGFAKEALRQAVALAGQRGIPSVMVSCHESNEASRRTIEACGGVYDGSRNDTRRYWIATS